MNGTELFSTVERIWRASLPPSIPPRIADQFIAVSRAELVAFIDELLAAKRTKSAQETQQVDDPPELWTKARRTKANLEALQILASKSPEALTAAERSKLLAYSGWGGLSIEEVKPQIPAGLEPETFGLIHEYYTPLQIADAIAEHVCPLLPELAGHDGVVRVLEPSVGVGRFLRAMGRPQCINPQGAVRGLEWVTVEFSKVSSRLLTALRPDAQHHHMPFERFVREHGSQYAGRVNLVLSNPPYGERGAFAAEDPNPVYRERVAYAYFLRRALDLLVPGGLGVFIIPGGFLTGERNRELRGRVLARHHLAAAFRLPSHRPNGRDVFAGASVVVDVLFFRARGGELTATDEADRFILDGKYFEHFPTHVLGKPEGELTPAESGDEEVKPRRTWRYQIVGEFTGIPEFTERPMCAACSLREIPAEAPMRYESAVRETAEPTEGLDNVVVRAAVELGMRIDRYLAAIAANDADKAEGLWPELRKAVLDFRGRLEIDQAGGPWGYKSLRTHAAKSVAAQQLLNAFTPKGELAPALADPPKVTRRYTGSPGDVIAQAEHLFRARRRLTGPDLLAFHREVGGKLTETEIAARLLEAKWNIDEGGEHEARGVYYFPLDAYVTGNLWPKYDRARARAATDPQAAVQAKRLMEAIGPAVFEDISDITPSQRWVPLPLVAAWISEVYNRELGPVELERVAGLVRIKGSLYARTDALPGLSADAVWILGWVNHDKRLFSPEGDDDDLDDDERRKMAERRTAKAGEYSESFANWLRDSEERRQMIADAYSREFRGIITPEFSSDPISIARWGEKGPQLKPHQVAGVRRIVTLRRGLVGYDVGVGKTYTAIGGLSLARQEGWAQRPVVLVPSSLVWKWYDDFRCCLPDYRVLVNGSNRRRGVRGKNKGVLTSETDTPEERAQKWQAFQAGQADVMILSFDALARTKVNEDAVVEYAKQVEAIRREVALKQSIAADKKARGRTLTERQEAILKHGVRAFVQEHLQLPEGHRFDPGIAWDDLGVDMLIVDEAAAFKNLYMPEAREAGVPKFMGGSGDGSHRAWQLDFRAAIVRKHTGGSGIVLLTATPAKNSPLEFYNLIQMIDPRAFNTRLGDAEQFIDRYIRIETRKVLGIDFKVDDRSAVTGFKNLDELRNIIQTYGEFRTAKEVGLKLPTPRIQLIEVDMDPYQDRKYEKYVKQIEESLSDKSMGGGEILGLLARMSLVALHGWLDEGYKWQNALTGGESVEIVWSEDETKKTVTKKLAVPEFRAPKLVACAKRIAAQRQCGHIIFCEPTAVHAWMREVLVQEGVPRERIAILNAEVTKPADRIRIAREFNGLPAEAPQTAEGCALRGGPETELAPRYDVVIANSVAYEGVDLQVRTCTIHHIDLPWTPSDLEQRNGRAYRQGNRLGTLEILYYMSKRSMDGYRFGLIDGKANWLGAVLESGRRDTNNPAAQQDLSPEQILLMISRNPAETAKRVEAAKQKAIDEERLRVAREAARLMTQASARFRDARLSADPDTAAQLRAEGHVRLRQLRKYDAAAWPWARWIDEAERVEYLVPPDGEAPVYEGLRVAIPNAFNPDEIKFYEFGRLISSEGPPCIGVRASRTARWLCQDLRAIKDLKLRPEHLPGGPVPWDSEDEGRIAEALTERVETWSRGVGTPGNLVVDWRSLGFTSASDAWLERWWPRVELRVREALSVQAEAQTVPALVEGALSLRKGPEVRAGVLMPPTLAGWQQFLALAPTSGEKFTDLKKAGELWWARKIPQTLLAASEDDEDAERAAPTGEPEREDRPSVAPAQDDDGLNALARRWEEEIRKYLKNYEEQYGEDEGPDFDGLAAAITRDALAAARAGDDDLVQRFHWLESALDNTFAPRDFAEFVDRLIDPGVELGHGIRLVGLRPASRSARDAEGDKEDATKALETARKEQPVIADSKTTKTLARRLRSLVDQSVRIGRINYYSPDVEIRGDEIAIHYIPTEDGAASLTFYAQPRESEQIALRGELVPDEGDARTFGWQIVRFRDFIEWNEGALARWFGVDLVPERKLTPPMIQALTSLRAEEEAEPEKVHPWNGVTDRMKESLIARGLVRVIENRSGGFPSYKTTPAGRAYLEPPAPAPTTEASVRPEARPRGDDNALAALAKKHKLAATFKLDGRVYTQEPGVRRDRAEITRVYKADQRRHEPNRPELRLFLAPRDNEVKAIDLRGEMINSVGRVSARFDWVPSNLISLRKLTAETLAGMFDLQPLSEQEDTPDPAFDINETWQDSFERRFAAGFPFRVRLAAKRGAAMYIYAIYRDDGSQPVASLDVEDDADDIPTLHDVRWLDDSVRPGERERIRQRVEDSLRPVNQRITDDGEIEEIPAMQLMVELLDQRTRALRARPAPPPTTKEDAQGVQGLAQLLRVVATPAYAPSELLSFLEAHRRKKAATLLTAYVDMPDMPFERFMTALWQALVEDMQVHPTGVDRSDRVMLNKEVIHETDKGRHVFALLDQGRPIQRIERLALPEPLTEDDAFLYVRHADPFEPRMTLLANPEAGELGEHMRRLRESLSEAPVYLADVRRALQLAGYLVDTVGCQGETRRQTLKALEDARIFYSTARDKLLDGRTAGALGRIAAAMQRIALAAIDISRTCAEGQQTMPGLGTSLPVAPADRKLLDNHGARRPDVRQVESEVF